MCRPGLLALALLGSACGRIGFSGDAAMGGDDGGGNDASDGQADGAVGMPMIQSSAGDNSTNVGLDLTRAIPGESVALVAILLGSDCALDPSVSTVDSVTMNSIALTRVSSILGTPCNASLTRTEVWILADPPVVAFGDIDVDLPGLTQSVHVHALLVTGVDVSAPVRDAETVSGNAATASVTVDTVPGDLVLSWVGQGDFIESPTTGTPVLLLNNSASRTLDNTAMSQRPATATTTALAWQFEDPDEYQMIAVALRPR